MEGQTNCVLCEFKSRSTNSLKQHMENKHNVFNMTIVQVLTQQVERVNKLESEMKEKEELFQKAEADCIVTKEALKKEMEILEQKEKAFEELITSQKKKAAVEAKLVEELKSTKRLLTKAHQDLEAKNNALNAEIKKVKASEVSTLTVSPIKQVSNVKQEENEAYNGEKFNAIPCKYFNKLKGCRRGSKCWFHHDENYSAEKKRTKLKQNHTKRLKNEQNIDKESKQEQGSTMNQVILQLFKLLLRENNI